MGKLRQIHAKNEMDRVANYLQSLGWCGYKALHTLKNHYMRGIEPRYKVYADTGEEDVSSIPSMIVIADEFENDFQLTMQVASLSAGKQLLSTELESAISSTLFTSGRKVTFSGIHAEFLRDPIITKIKQVKLNAKIGSYPCSMFYLKDTSTLDQALFQVPPNCYVDSLRLEHAELVNSTWPHGAKETLPFTTHLIKRYMSVCLYENDNPVCWCLEQPYGGIGMLYTKQEARRKGYSRIVLALMSSKILSSGFCEAAFAYVVSGNAASYALFKSMGFIEAPSQQDWQIMLPSDAVL